jgi:hypothetical protein
MLHDTSTRRPTLKISIARPWAAEKSQSIRWFMRDLPIAPVDLATHRTSTMRAFSEGFRRLGKSFCRDRHEGNFSLFCRF